MRILQISSARHFGGGERHVVDLANALAQRGNEVFVALIAESPLRAELAQLPAANIITLAFRNALDIASAWKLRKFVRAHEIEIIHAHVARDYPLAALAVGGSSKAKLVLTRHVMFPMSKVHRLTQNRVSRVIAVSGAVDAGLRAQQIFSDKQITVVRHGIDLGRFQLAAERKSFTGKDGLRVGILGDLSPVKGQVDFVRAAGVIAAQRNDVEFVIAGRDQSATANNQRELEKLIHKLGLTSRVRLMDTIEDVPAFLAELDVCVSASHSEAFGLAIIEAMACGTPVVATMSDGAREIIEDNRTGRLVPIGGVAEMASAIAELLSDGEKRQSLAANARRAVTDRFSVKRMVDETEQVYREVLDDTPRR